MNDLILKTFAYRVRQILPLIWLAFIGSESLFAFSNGDRVQCIGSGVYVRSSTDTASSNNIIGTESVGLTGTYKSGLYAGVNNSFTWYLIKWDNISQDGYTASQYVQAAAVTLPTVTTNAATNMTSTGATLNGTITGTGGGTITEARIEWTPTASGFPGTVIYNVPVSGNTFSSSVSGLQPSTGYTYHVYAKNSAGFNAATNNVTFTTSAAAVTLPTVTTNAATNVTSTGATLNGTITGTGGGTITEARIEWTPTASGFPGTVIYNVPVSGNTFSSSASGLQPNTGYTYHVYAKNSAGFNATTNNIPFTTSAAALSNLTGFVYDNQSSQPLSNVTVTLGATSRTTNSSGFYSFTGVAQGTYTLSVNHSGYGAYATSVSLPNTPSRDIALIPNFTTNPTSSLSGYVRDDATGAGLSGKTVSLSNGRSAVTDGNGYYSFSSFNSGVFTVTVDARSSGYLLSNQTVTFTGVMPPLTVWLTRNQTVLGAQTPSGYSADPVNTATGNYIYNKVDLKLPGIGMPFVFERAYNSQDGTDGPLGIGWNHSYNAKLTVDGSNNVTIRWGDSRTDTYKSNGSGGFTPPQHLAVFDKLTAIAGGGYTLLKKDQTVYKFDVSNRLASIVDKNGNTIALAYTGTNLTTITDTAGRTISFTSNANNLITKVTDPLNRTIQFA